MGILPNSKRKRITTTLVLAFGMAIMIGFGYWRYHTMKTIFTVVGILFALPIAKVLSGFLVVLPFRTIKKERYEGMKNAMKGIPADQILWDLALSSTEKVRYFPCVVCSDKEVLVLYENKAKDSDAEEAKKYFRNLLKRNSHRAEFLFFTEEEEFVQQALKINLCNQQEEEIKRIRQTILVYEM